MRTRTNSSRPQRNPSAGPTPRTPRTGAIHWIFSSNLPHRRSSAALSVDLNRRNFFGMSEVLNVLLNPSETARSLTESRRLLDEARKEINEEREVPRLRIKHAVTRLSGFLPRETELQVIERVMEGEPSFTVLFGASAVGKTALLREVLSRDRFHVLHFDLRIPGFADVSSLYMSLSQQIEQYFEDVSTSMPGFEEFRKEACAFKYDRLDLERRLSEAPVGSVGSQVRTSDISRLMELFQYSLVRYAEFDPPEDVNEPGSQGRKESDVSSERTHVNNSPPFNRSRWFFKRAKRASDSARGMSSDMIREPGRPSKKTPVLFFDEAHRLPSLVQSSDTIKCLLDSMLVLTKQDRLCHVVHATSDPFYQNWLRQLNVVQHCKLITIDDCSRSETRTYFLERLLPRVPEALRPTLSFDVLYEAFGGKLAHWQDYISEYINAGGNFDIKQCSAFLQAHATLNLHIVHSSQLACARDPTTPSTPGPRPRSSGPDALHAGLGPAGFKSYPPREASSIDDYSADFSAMQLLKVMSKLSQPGTQHLPYFLLCRKSPVGKEPDIPVISAPVSPVPMTHRVLSNNSYVGGASGTVGVESSEDGDMVMVNPVNLSTRDLGQIDEGAEHEIIGPKLTPLTPIMRFAMREVVQEYEDVRTVSEYASLNDPDEY
ncbi:hypothetical protein JVT61DRAFT_8271 [Boletus reticuloceps]|uniref:AAA+ ATPase domain-containing protein n=1 Tax=Boletus reticuloceps TaxID=495285 RepID=A0A8I2Z0N9_9AGAM|nr:hypothetical protein JVT61DRAFT_8271 [Boletus reticuloceps]